MNPTRILITTNLGSASAEAQRQGAALAARCGAQVALCHVVARTSRRLSLPGQDGWRSELESVLARQYAASTGTGRAPDQILIEEGPVVGEILARAQAWGADRVVVGAHRHAGGLLSSVAERVVRGATCPVLVARPGTGTGVVVAGTDFSDPSLPAVRAADAEAQRRGGRLVLVHCLEIPPAFGEYGLHGVGSLTVPSGGGEALREAQQKMRAAQAACTTPAEGLVFQGLAVNVLNEVAAQRQADLVVVGCQGRSGLERLLLGSTAEMVLRSAPCPVLAVRLHRPPGPGKAGGEPCVTGT